MTTLSLQTVDQRDLVDRPENWLLQPPRFEMAGAVSERHMRRNLRGPGGRNTERAACRAQFGRDLVQFAASPFSRDDQRTACRATIELHDPVEAEREWSGSHGAGCLSGARDEYRVWMVYSCYRTDGKVERGVTKGLAGPEDLPCCCHMRLDFGRRNGSKKQHVTRSVADAGAHRLELV